jgi:mono/diheme cytochrome c family protein
MMLRRVLILNALATSVAAATPEQLEFYEKQVRPLFAAHCYSCHSAQAKPRFAGLSLDSSAAVRRGSDAGPVVVPGKPAESRLILAVSGRLPVKMPPAGRLSGEQIAVLTRWVEMGAPMPEESAQPSHEAFDLERRRREHWAWQPVKTVDPPAVRDGRWPLQPTDKFLLAKLEREGLAPAAPADRPTFLRRLSFDLTGLPPSPDEVRAFESDRSAGAYEKQVDRMLASPRFGEHWARHWMDLVRYAESHGSEGDPDTPMAWRYRDYLIRAFNQDVPYDQLIREHMAGDLLPQPRVRGGINESLLAVAHWRMVEHGFQPVDPLEDRLKWTDNQVDVLSKAFQGLTISCARCHDHKFDAISQKDYYALYGVLAGMRPTQSAIDTDDVLRRDHAELERRKREIRSLIAAAWQRALAGLPDWLRGQPEQAPRRLETPLDFWLALRRGEQWQDLASKLQPADSKFRVLWDVRTGFDSWLKRGPGIPVRPSAPGEFWILPAGENLIHGIYPSGVYTNLLSAKHNGVLSSPRFKIDTDYISVRMLGGNYGAAQLIIENYAVPRGGIYALRALPKEDKMHWLCIPTAFWKGFTAYLEFSTVDDATVFQPEKDARKAGDGRSWFGVQTVVAHDGKQPPPEIPEAVKFAISGELPQSLDDLAAHYQGLLRRAIDAWQAGTLRDGESAFLDSFVRTGFLPAALDRLPEVKERAAGYRRLEANMAQPHYAPSVLQEPSPAQPLLIRGNLKNPGPAVPLRYLEALDRREYPDPMRARLELADAIASPRNPLTARVMVNRIWRYMFGAGLVRTVDNFGKLGEPPSHPELLDWLATRFVSDGWSIKKMVRMLATSQAYRMSSVGSAEAHAKDPANRWLQHANVRRLEAEAIRDSILWVSGELKPDMYGPSVPTYYAHDTGRTKGDRPKGPLDGNGRRSIYLEVRRNVTNPLLEAFDAPKISTTRGERDLTNVPAQSLALLNNPFIIQQAEKWAAAMESVAPVERVNEMFWRAFGRPPTAEERTASEVLLEALRAEPHPWSDFAHSLFDLKEFIYIR